MAAMKFLVAASFIAASTASLAQLQDGKATPYERAQQFAANGEFTRAITEFADALRTAPNDARVLDGRGFAYSKIGDMQDAMADFNAAIKADPGYAPAYFHRGITEFVDGKFDAAAKDFTMRENAGATLNAYTALWRFMARRKTALEAANDLAANAARLDLGPWPGAVLRLFLGKAKPEDVNAAAASPRTACEATFYIGEYHLLRGNMNTAVAILQDAASRCPRETPEYDAAMAEFAWLP
jgi:lipoprotein NlpI